MNIGDLVIQRSLLGFKGILLDMVYEIDRERMDFKTTKYNKGDMVRLKKWGTESLGIVKEQDAATVRVHWLICPEHIYNKNGSIMLHNLIPVQKGD